MPIPVNIEGIGKVNFPDDYTPDRIKFAIENDILPRVSRGTMADLVPGGGEMSNRNVGKPSETGLLNELKGAGEAALTLGTGLVGGIAGPMAGLARGINSPNWGSPENNKAAQDRAREVSAAMTYQPRTEAGQRNVEAVAGALDASKLAGLNPAAAIELSAGVRPAVSAFRVGTDKALDQARTAAAALRKAPEPEMAGVGAAETAQEAIRRQRAAALPVPVKLTKGEATRQFEQQRFEKETMKDSALGEPLRQRAADNVGAVLKSFESWVDETGAQAPDLIGTGKAVDRALVKRMEGAKAEIRNAYAKAEQSGEMAAPVDVRPLAEFLSENRSAMKLAPVLKAAEDEMVRLGGAERNGTIVFPEKMSLNDVEKVRKLVVKLSKADDTNAHFGGEANKVIDAMTEGSGGDLYKQARGMFKEYAAEFKNQGAVRKLVTTKPGGSDRAVALEDVFNHSVLSGSNRDTANILTSLERAGPEGMQGIQELRGATMNYLLGKTTENAGRDIRGQPIPSFAKLDRAVRSLDADGKLDLIFGKQRAMQIRDLKELVADIQTAPPGVVNTSTTAAVLKDALVAAATGRIPTALAKSVQGIKQAVGDRSTMKRVRDALIDPNEDLSGTGGTVH